MTLGDVIKSFRESNNLTMQEFADRAGLSKGYISMLEKNKNPANGDPIIPSITTFRKIADAMGRSIQNLAEYVEQDISLESTPSNMVPVRKAAFRPLIGTIACGEPILAEQNFETYIPVPEEIKCDFVLRCKGDSMIDAGIHDGDLVYIRQQEDVNDGEIAAVLLSEDSEATLKRVYHSEEQVTLMPANPNYKPLSFVGEAINDLRIMGLAVAVTQRLR